MLFALTMHPRNILVQRIVCLLALIAGLFCARPSQAAQAAKPKWIRVSSDHFSVLTDADEKKGREVAVRLEQMRSVFGQLLFKRKLNMSEPLEIIAFRPIKNMRTSPQASRRRPRAFFSPDQTATTSS